MRQPERLQQPVLIAVLDLLRRKSYIEQILSERSRYRFFQLLEIQLCLFLLHQPHRHIHPGNDILRCVHIAAVNMADAVFVKLETFSYLSQFFLIHKSFLPVF